MAVNNLHKNAMHKTEISLSISPPDVREEKELGIISLLNTSFGLTDSPSSAPTQMKNISKKHLKREYI